MKGLAILVSLLIGACSLPGSAPFDTYMFIYELFPSNPSLNDTVTVKLQKLPKSSFETKLLIIKYDATRSPHSAKTHEVSFDKFQTNAENSTHDVRIDLSTTFLDTQNEPVKTDANDSVALRVLMVDGRSKGEDIGIYQ